MNNNPNQPVPELVERALDALADVMDQLTYARNAVADATHHAIATEQVLLQLRQATNSVELTEHPQELNFVAPSPAALRGERRRRIRLAFAVLVIIVLAVSLAVV